MNIYDFAHYISVSTGNSLFFVGGCVRDRLMGRKTGDIDICSCIRPDDMLSLCKKSGVRCIPTGIDHGTVTLILDNIHYEHTSWRKDVIPDGRRSKVVFSDDMKDDALRRDFTINALYENILTGEIHDYFGGLDDLRKRVIRFIGKAEERLCEDFLRIFRYLRFINRFSFKYLQSELDIVRDKCNGISILSNERVRDEFIKIFRDGVKDYSLFCDFVTWSGNYHEIAGYFLTLLETSQNHPFHIRKDVLTHTLDLINMLDPDINSDDEYWCIVFHDMFKPDTLSTDKKGITHFYGHDSIFHEKFNSVMESFRLSGATRKKISFFICFHLKSSMLLEKMRSGRDVSDKEIFNLIFSMFSHNPKFRDFLEKNRDIMLTENKHKFGSDFSVEYDCFLKSVERFETIRISLDMKKISDLCIDKRNIRNITGIILKRLFCGKRFDINEINIGKIEKDLLS